MVDPSSEGTYVATEVDSLVAEADVWLDVAVAVVADCLSVVVAVGTSLEVLSAAVVVDAGSSRLSRAAMVSTVLRSRRPTSTAGAAKIPP